MLSHLLEITDARGFPPVPLPADLDVQEDIRENDLADAAAAAAAAVVCNDQAPRPRVVEQDEAGPGRSLAVEEPRVGGDVESPAERLHRVRQRRDQSVRSPRCRRRPCPLHANSSA